MKAFVGPVVLVLTFIAFSLLWRYTALADFIRVDALVARAETLRRSRIAALTVPLAIVVLSLLLVPVTLLRAATVIAFGPILGSVYALVGSTAAAYLGHAIGKHAGAAGLERVAGARVARIRSKLEGRGVLALAALRLLPLGPFTVVNAVAGAASIRRRDFMLATLLVMVPTLLLMALAVSAFPTLQDHLH